MSLFITGTDTGVGKTYLIVQLLRLLHTRGMRCVGFKPICCGDRRDAELLLAASSEEVTIDEVNPLWLRTPLAPFAASLIEHVEIEADRLFGAFNLLASRFDFIAVEGVGGWSVPITQNYFVSDLARAMNLPVLVVVENRLGCVNHTLLTLRSIEAGGAKCVGIVLNSRHETDNIASVTNSDTLRRLIEPPILAPLTEESTELPPDWVQAAKL